MWPVASLGSLANAAVLDFGVQAAAGSVAIALSTEKFYDLAGSGTFALCTTTSYLALANPHLRQTIQAGCVMAWSVRLGTFLFHRVLASGHDRRFKHALNKPPLFAFFWFLQGVWVFITLSPTLLMLSKTTQPALSSIDYIGWSMFAAGFALEVVADSQKSSFRSNPANANKFISHGAWSLSRHPNYFGEILLWSGLFLPTTQLLSGIEWVSVLSPGFVAYLLIRVSGIPILEKMAKKKWGDDTKYKDYVAKTSVLIPYLW